MKAKKVLSAIISTAMALALFAVPAHAAETNFTDVAADAYYADAVAWAVEKGITSGTSATTFSPNATCTRAQILTFIWRAKGAPEPETEKISSSNGNPFPDLNGSEYYFKAAQWAYTQGMVAGGMNFDGNKDCSRSLAMTYLWEMEGEPTPSGEAGFTDIIRALHNINAISWAVEQGITSGTSATTFSPDATCTRGQIVTFLYRSMGNKNSDTPQQVQFNGTVWDQAFYDTLTPNQQGMYKNADDSTRQQMKQFIESSRELESQGYKGNQSTSQEANKEAWSQITVGG